jgi:hypothetical protein
MGQGQRGICVLVPERAMQELGGYGLCEQTFAANGPQVARSLQNYGADFLAILGGNL